MKVYQMIYTSVKCSLSDPEIGLTNQAGLRVFSCTQGLTKCNIDEIIRFATYRLPKNNDVIYGNKPCDPNVPRLFPKIFRTLKLSDGRYAAMQISYAGYDFEGQPGNVFAHAFVFDDVDEDFLPEKYFGHPLYRTHLTEKDLEGQIVHYLKPLDGIEPTEGLEEKVISFINDHKNELTYILDKAMQMLTTDDIKNICIATNEHELTEMYLLALRWLLPRDGAEALGISTYNVYLPSDKQQQIVFHGTVKGRNNITQQAVEVRKNCMYIDVENTRFERDARSMLFRFSVQELREIYAQYKFTAPQQLLAWEATWENTTKSGIAGKLIRLKKTAGSEAFCRRVTEIYPAINDFNMTSVRYELSKIMFDNLELFPKDAKKITEIYLDRYIDKLCAGENVVMETNPFVSSDNAADLAAVVCGSMEQYTELIRDNLDGIPEVNRLELLKLFGNLKHALGKKSWKELFKTNEQLTPFIFTAASVIITRDEINPFVNIEGWEMSDLAELVAYFHSSTEDKNLKKSCLKFICSNQDEDWKEYGITVKKHEKPPEEREQDIQKIRRMLTKVGYVPYQRGTYELLRGEVMDDIYTNPSPLLISQLLYAIYRWKGTYGNQIEAEKCAASVRELIMKLRKEQLPCYNFMVPKIALEIIESQGHYHELIVNAETMPKSFWEWFTIGYERSKRDEDKLLSYTRVYTASKNRIPASPAKKKMQAVFKDIAD